MGKRHAKTVLENQGKAFDYSEFKNFSEVSKHDKYFSKIVI